MDSVSAFICVHAYPRIFILWTAIAYISDRAYRLSISLNEIGETNKLKLYTTFYGKPEWSSSDKSVATVDGDGTVTAVF